MQRKRSGRPCERLCLLWREKSMNHRGHGGSRRHWSENVGGDELIRGHGCGPRLTAALDRRISRFGRNLKPLANLWQSLAHGGFANADQIARTLEIVIRKTGNLRLDNQIRSPAPSWRHSVLSNRK